MHDFKTPALHLSHCVRTYQSLLILTFGCVLLYGGFVVYTYAGADFPPAVSYAMNFKTAFDDGQWLPRLVEYPREFQVGSGSVDGVPPTADAPVFQYYAFLASALSYPFLSAGIPAPNAVGCALLASFLIGAYALHRTGIVLGASKGMAATAAWSYLASPWLISNVYGRGGIAEGVSHALMPIVCLGIAYAVVGRYRMSFVLCAIGIALLALAHNIFLMYGALMAASIVGLYAVASVSMTRSNTETRRALLVVVTVGLAVATGLALSAWQWLPAYLSLKTTSFAGNVTGTAIPEQFSSFSGLFGLPARYSHVEAETPFFFTIGWWTIPSIAAAVILSSGRSRALAVAIAGTFVLLFVMCYFPKIIFPYLPSAFGATQVTFRILSVLSLCGAFSLCLITRPVRRLWLILLTVAITASQVAVIFYPMPKFRFTDEQYEKGWEVGAFSKASDLTPSPLRQDQVGATMNDNRIALEKWRVLSGVGTGPVALRIVGKIVPEDTADFDLTIDNPDSGAVLSTRRIATSVLDFTLPLDSDAAYIHVGAPTANVVWSVLRANRVYLLPADADAYVYAEDLEKIESYGLTRTFKVSAERIAAATADTAAHFLEIPMVGNMFLVARQDGKRLESWSDLNNRLNVRVESLTAPVEVRYEIPQWIWVVTLAGILMLIAVGAGRRPARRQAA